MNNRFDFVDLGRPSINEQIQRERKKTADTLLELLEEGEIQGETTVAELIKVLCKED